jgi:hypothetical protein
MPYIGKGDCDHCGKDVEVKTDKNGMAYYKCGPCGFEGWHSKMTSSQKFLAEVRRDTEPEGGSEPPEISRESQEIPERKPAAQDQQKPKKRGLMDNTIFGG